MSDERAIVEAKRLGYAQAKVEAEPDGFFESHTSELRASCVCRTAYLEAKRKFPMPAKIEPRVTTDAGGTKWRVVEGELQYLGRTKSWISTLSASTLAIAIELAQNPTVTIASDD